MSIKKLLFLLVLALNSTHYGNAMSQPITQELTKKCTSGCESLQDLCLRIIVYKNWHHIEQSKQEKLSTTEQIKSYLPIFTSALRMSLSIKNEDLFVQLQIAKVCKLKEDAERMQGKIKDKSQNLTTTFKEKKEIFYQFDKLNSK